MRFLLLLPIFFLSAHADIYTQKLYEKILGSIFQERPIAVFATGDARATLEKSKLFYLVANCQESDVAVVGNGFTSEQECKNIPIFTTTHKSYVDLADAFGAFYWRKGRPQIHFRKREVTMFHLRLSTDMQRFIDEK